MQRHSNQDWIDWRRISANANRSLLFAVND
jgi:hypothetical protein